MAPRRHKAKSAAASRGKAPSFSFMLSPLEDSAAFKHCGFLLTAVESDLLRHIDRCPHCESCREQQPCELWKSIQEGKKCWLASLAGAECQLSYQGANATILVHGREEFQMIPRAASADESMVVDASTPDSSQSSDRSRGKRRVGSAVAAPPSILAQLQRLASTNGVKFRSRVVKVANKGAAIRVVVLIDLFLPMRHFLTLRSWRGGAASAFAINHLCCDWQRRQELLSSGECVDSGDLWNISECQALGCSLHPSVSASVKKTRFDLHEIFKSLSARKAENGFLETRMHAAAENPQLSGLWDLPDEVLASVLGKLRPKDLMSVAATCKHIRVLTRTIVPCMNLRLFPHQKAAVQWMIQRENNAGRFASPLYKGLQTEDGFHIYFNCVTGELAQEVPEIDDFRGGLFCDEPGLGKTITALSLILKSQGNLPSPPQGVEVYWSSNRTGDRVGYYEAAPAQRKSSVKRGSAVKARRYQLAGETLADNGKRKATDGLIMGPAGTRRKLGEAFGQAASEDGIGDLEVEIETSAASEGMATDDVWVQCDGCKKWRKLEDGSGSPKAGNAWFCKMNPDSTHQDCSVPEESWDRKESISSLAGFCKEGETSGLEKNVSFFYSLLKDRASLLSSETKKALNWLASISFLDHRKLATSGLSVPQHLRMASVTGRVEHDYELFFESFGLVRKVDKQKVLRWQYPGGMEGSQLDTEALKSALARPVEEVTRVYLSKATLVVVPANLVDHWVTQIQRHTRDSQLRVCVCSKTIPTSHNLAWDFDIVITTFNRLSLEWNSRESSLLMQIHWLRIILDEGHTLGASLSFTNKLQMAVNMRASYRWVLTGTPTPDTPNSQLVSLHPMLRFLHDDLYGGQLKLWDAAVLRPFEAQSEEGRLRLMDMLGRCMISARKADLKTIPPCVRKVKLVEFTRDHAASYNELVETVRRNLLMADWNDPDHVESLLNPKQWKLKNSTLRNVRLSCCVAGHIKMRNANQDIQETMDELVTAGMDPASQQYAFIHAALLAGGNCYRCGEWCRLPILTPCYHLLCISCVAMDDERCSLPGCGNAYKMQTPKARPENPNPKWPVPQDLIELQPSYIQEDWHSEWQSTSSSKVTYLLEQLKALCQDVGQLPEKAIVFSQFLEHISIIELQLTKAGIQHAGMYSPMHSFNKMKALKTFQDDPNCVVLLLDSSSALGLDLSFVTHVFLMEPIWDRSIEEQVVSRAHRMGATRPVLVETLAMSGTIEEQMLNFLQRSSDPSRNHNHDPAELQYLSRLAFVRKKSSQ